MGGKLGVLVTKRDGNTPSLQSVCQVTAVVHEQRDTLDIPRQREDGVAATVEELSKPRSADGTTGVRKGRTLEAVERSSVSRFA